MRKQSIPGRLSPPMRLGYEASGYKSWILQFNVSRIPLDREKYENYTPHTLFIPYYHATYWTLVPIIDSPYIVLLLSIDQQQDSELLAWKRFNTTMPPAPYCYTSTWHYTRAKSDEYKHDSCKYSMPYSCWNCSNDCIQWLELWTANS